MSEKKGQLEKLKYDFNTAQGVFIKRNDKMYRVTERDLPDGTYEYIPYKGRIYYHNTNQKCKECIGDGLIQYAHNKPWVSIRRPGENYLVS